MDKCGNYAFRDAVKGYLRDFTCRVSANVLCPHGGGCGSNNATEAKNKVTHKQCPIKKPPVAHALDLMTHMHSTSVADSTYDARLRRDIWNHDTFLAVHHCQHFAPYPLYEHCRFNIVDCSFHENVMIERLTARQLAFDAASGEPRIVDFKTAMTASMTKCLLVPTYGTMQTIVSNHPHVFQVHKNLSSAETVLRVKSFLTSKTSNGGLSWLQQMVRFLNVPARLALEELTLAQWLALSNSFAVLVPLTDHDDIARYLGRLEEGVPVENVESKRHSNGCTIVWSKIPDSGIYYCLCCDHALRGVCLHVILWLVSEGIVLPPAKFSAVRIAGKGRPEAFMDGSALLRDAPASRHATHKLAKGLANPHLQQDARLALVACKGIISLHNDSVRKYAHDEYMHGRRHRQAKAAVPKRGRTSTEGRKRHARSAAREHAGRAHDSDSDVRAPPARKRGGKDRGGSMDCGRGKGSVSRSRGKRRAKSNASDESDGAGTRPMLPAGSSAAAAKYLSILASNMSDASKTDVIETMLLAESDRSLKSFMTDHLEDQLPLERLASILQDNYEED